MQTLMDRRLFVRTGTGLALGGALGGERLISNYSVAVESMTGFIRYSAFDPRARLDSYRRGVEKMRQWSAQNADDPRGWSFQAAIHGSMMAGTSFNQCEHSSWWFFSWHRAYLYFFERIIRKAS